MIVESYLLVRRQVRAARSILRRRSIRVGALGLIVLLAGVVQAQTAEGSKPVDEARPAQAQNAKADEVETPVEKEKEEEIRELRTDITLLLGSDFVRPGGLPRGNLSLGVGHVFELLRKDPLGDGITFGYAYENTGMHGFVDSDHGEHSELLGLMKDFKLSKAVEGKQDKLTGYNWLQGGISSLTGDAHVANRFSWSETLGVKLHITRSSAIWVQESYNKVVTLPWYTITSLGYTYSF